MNVLKLSDIMMSAKRLKNGKKTVGVYTPTIPLNMESAATFITTCSLKKANKNQISKYSNKKGVRILCRSKQGYVPVGLVISRSINT